MTGIKLTTNMAAIEILNSFRVLSCFKNWPIYCPANVQATVLPTVTRRNRHRQIIGGSLGATLGAECVKGFFAGPRQTLVGRESSNGLICCGKTNTWANKEDCEKAN